MAFVLGRRSKQKLVGVHPHLVAVVERAITITKVDFAVTDGVRTEAEQRRLVEIGASKTMNSRHLNGFAVDLVPYINGGPRWEWEPIYIVADAVRRAAREEKVNIRWGGCWSVFTQGLDAKMSTIDLVENYVTMRRNLGKRAFIDGPHYELPRTEYL